MTLKTTIQKYIMRAKGYDHPMTPERATEAILQAFLDHLPKELNTDGSEGKWVNGWNDYAKEIKDVIEEKSNE